MGSKTFPLISEWHLKTGGVYSGMGWRFQCPIQQSVSQQEGWQKLQRKICAWPPIEAYVSFQRGGVTQPFASLIFFARIFINSFGLAWSHRQTVPVKERIWVCVVRW